MSYPRLTIPKAEVDTFAASAAINLAVSSGFLPVVAANGLKAAGNTIARDILSGRPVLTVDDNGNYVEVVLAEAPAVGDYE
jgi:hypothetical protein